MYLFLYLISFIDQNNLKVIFAQHWLWQAFFKDVDNNSDNRKSEFIIRRDTSVSTEINTFSISRRLIVLIILWLLCQSEIYLNISLGNLETCCGCLGSMFLCLRSVIINIISGSIVLAMWMNFMHAYESDDVTCIPTKS